MLAAQNIPVVDDTTMPAPQQPGHALIQGAHETVDPASGQVTLRFSLPLPAEPGGSQPRFAITYSSAGAVFATGKPTGGAQLDTQASALASQGWSYTAPVVTFDEIETSPNGSSDCELSTGYILETADGQRHSFHLSVVGDNTKSDPQDGCPQQYPSDTEPDGWIGTTVGDTQPGPYVTQVPAIQGPDGQTMTFAGGGEGPEFGWVPSRVTDRNGNWLAYSLNAASNNALTITDSLGRTLVTTTGFQPAQSYSSLTDTIDAAGAGYSAVWKTGWAAASRSISPAGPAPCPAESTGSGGNAPVITSLNTPEGTYQFSYNSTYGVLDKITYPNGGYVRYLWGETSGPAEAGVFYTMPGSGQAFPCMGVYPAVVVTDRYVSPDGVNETEHQQFSYTTAWNPSATELWTTKTTTVTTTDSTAGTSWTTNYSYIPEYSPSPANDPIWENLNYIPVESQVATVQSGNTLRQVDEFWTLDYPYLPTDRRLQRNDHAVNEQCFTYNATGQTTDKYEYNGVPGCAATADRHTHVAYATFSTNILDRPREITITDPNSTGTTESDTQYGYSPNGDLTSASRLVGSSVRLVTNFTNLSDGNRATMTEPNTGQTQWLYNGTGGDGVHPTEIIDALGNTRFYTWNAASGTMATSKDESGNTTSYGYDSWNRLTSVVYPTGGGETTFSYTPSTFDTGREQSSGASEDTLDTFDGLGRLAVVATETSAGNYNRVDTCYNGAGEKDFVTYPYASTSKAGPANCGEPGDSFAYDGLGRPTQTTHSDGSTFLTSYTVMQTETQDEGNGAARVTRIAETDGLGRLAEVCEGIASHGPTDGPAATTCASDIGLNGYLTTYAHDVLDDLTGVTQGAETRAFTYDDLGRLTQSSTPEAGTTHFDYGAASGCASSPGDLVARVDAKNVTTCFTYNLLHQVTGKTYSDGSTPAVTYAYGQTSAFGISGLANTLGRLSSESTASDTAEVFSYDALGRTVRDIEFTPLTWAGPPFSHGYTYDLAGDLTGDAYSRGATLTSGYDLVGRPLSLSSNTNGTLISGVVYDGFGHVTAATLGNGISVTRGYDARGRLTSLSEVNQRVWVPATHSTGSFTVSGTDNCEYADCDYGDVSAEVEGEVSADASYDDTSDASSIATDLASQLSGTAVTAYASGSGVYLTSVGTGSGVNYSLLGGSETQDDPPYRYPSFHISTSGQMTGGADGHYTGGTTVYGLSGVSWAPDGDLLGVADTANGTFSYAYNDLNQLTAASCTAAPCSGDSAAYAYDRYGNRWTETGTLPAAAPAALSFTGNNNRVDGWSYDADGNLLNDGSHTYQYDAENRLTSVDGGSTASYVYDAEGRRVHESVQGVVKEFIYGEGDQQLTVVDGSGNLMQAETDFGGQYLGTEEPSTFVWAAADELGTVRVRTNAGGALIETDTSWPFGAYLNNVGAYSNLHFTGKYRDSASGLDYFRARYYSSSLGRILTPDPLGGDIYNPQSLNRYAYAWNNPVTITDPTGMYVCADSTKGHQCTSASDKAFAASLAHDLASTDKAAVKAAEAYGKINVDNGVTVAFGGTKTGDAGETTYGYGASATTGNGWRAEVKVGIRAGESGEELNADIAHEGTHIANAQAFVASWAPRLAGQVRPSGFNAALNLSRYADEFSAYSAGSGLLAADGFYETFGTVVLGAGVGPAATRAGIAAILADPGGRYRVTPSRPGPSMYPQAGVPH